jgi:3-methylcrotonyl-CoA carboxylase alpha subunit
VRIDSGFRAGDTITHFSDPMIAKVVGHGASRDAAIARSLETLRRIRIDGPTTNLGFLCATLDHPAFRRGEVFTGFIDRFKTELLEAVPTC